MKEHEEEQKTSATPQVTTTPMSQLKSQLSKPLMDLNNSSPSKPYTATPIPCSSGISGVSFINSVKQQDKQTSTLALLVYNQLIVMKEKNQNLNC